MSLPSYPETLDASVLRLLVECTITIHQFEANGQTAFSGALTMHRPHPLRPLYSKVHQTNSITELFQLLGESAAQLRTINE